MDLQQLTQQINNLEQAPPFEQWHPEFCGDIDMEIKADGRWFYMGTPITRDKLVKLFASVLITEDDQYFLKTPVEKVRIKVEDAPFVITGWEKRKTSDGDALEVSSNLDHKVIVSPQHPINLDHSDPEQPKVYVTLHRGLKAKVHRNVYYQWINEATEQLIENKHHLMIKSGKHHYSLGTLDESHGEQ